MKWLPETDAKVASLKLPGDVKARMKAPHVIELAESIRNRTGGRPIHLPTFEYPSKELIAGRDRMAAALINGEKTVRIQLVSQLTAKERRDLERDENIHRRVDDRDALIKQRVDEREAEISRERDESGEADAPRKPGRPKTARGEAREQVAREFGTTPDAVRVAEARAEDEEELPNKSSESDPLPCPVETYGLPLVTPVEADQLRGVQRCFEEADLALRRAQAQLGGAEAVAVFAGVAAVLKAQVHGAASAVRSARPVAVCPYCKRIARPLNQTPCPGCMGAGFVGADQMLGVADELKLGGDQAMVSAGGKLVPYAKALVGGGNASGAARSVRASAPPPTKRIRIETEAGEDITPPWEAEG